MTQRLFGIGLLIALSAIPASAQQSPATASPCRATEISRNLDFWVGDWDVYVGATLDGTDNVERILGGCAVTERWHGSDGDEGFSLFAYDARKDLWTQSWVTDNSAVPGGIKLKVLRAHTPTGTTFQGEIEGRTGAVYYDRTILTALPGGRVHQQIQVSRDGIAWRTGFDAIYVPHGQKPQAQPSDIRTAAKSPGSARILSFIQCERRFADGSLHSPPPGAQSGARD